MTLKCRQLHNRSYDLEFLWKQHSGSSQNPNSEVSLSYTVSGSEGCQISQEPGRRGEAEFFVVKENGKLVPSSSAEEPNLRKQAKQGELLVCYKNGEAVSSINLKREDPIEKGPAKHEDLLVHKEDLEADDTAFLASLGSCARTKDLYRGIRVHADLLKRGLLEKSSYVGNALISMYAKCGSLAKAKELLDGLSSRNVVSWTALITGYVRQGQAQDALNCFDWMQQEGLTPDAVTFACILKACGSIGACDKGEQIHHAIARQGLLRNNVVLSTALLDMYAKCGVLAKARQVLEELPSRDLVSWNALIAGYALQGKGLDALNCYEQMLREGFSPDAVTYACILKACGSIGAVEKGGQFHNEISKQGLLGKDVVLETALVDMYAKCGALAKARQLLEELSTQDIVLWNALIAGYAQQGQSQDVLSCFESMQCKGLSPDAFTLSCVLNACSHSGLVDEGQMYFASMGSKYGTKPSLEHYTCMVDLFGRAGHLDKAVAMIQKMPSFDYCVVWRALLGACQKWQDVNIGRWAFEHAMQINKCDVAAYDLMANIYSVAGMVEEAKNIEAMRIKNKAFRKPGEDLTESAGPFCLGNQGVDIVNKHV